MNSVEMYVREDGFVKGHIPEGYTRHSADLLDDQAEFARAVADAAGVKLVDITRALFSEFMSNKSLQRRVVRQAKDDREVRSQETGERLTESRRAATESED